MFTLRTKLFILITICLMLHSKEVLYAGGDGKDAQDYKAAYNYILNEKWDNAYEALNKFITEHKKSKYYDAAHFWHCYSLEKKGESLEEVFDCYHTFIQKHPGSKWANDAKTNMIAIGKKLSKSGKHEYETIIKSMQECDDQEIALSAIYALTNMGDEKALDALLKLYEKQKDSLIREKILYALSEFDNTKATAKLMEIARNDKEPKLRKKAVYWLAENAKSEEIIQFLESIAQKDPDREIRKHALYAMADLPGNRGTEILMKAVQNDSDTEIRKTAVYWLGDNAKSDKIIQFLENIALHDPEADVAQHAVYALSEAPNGRGINSLFKIAKSHNRVHVRKKAVYFLGENSRNTQTVAFLLKIAKTDPSFEVREHAVYALAEVPEGRGTSALMDIVQSSKETEIRKKAVYWLGDKAKSVEIIQFIENVALEDTNEEVAAYAVYALAEAPKGKGNTSLMKIAKKHKNPHLRKKAVYWLGDQAHSEREVTFLENLLKNESDFEVQENILQALAEARKNQGIPALIKIAKFHENKSLRKKAIFWLGESNDPRAKQALLDIIETLH